MGTVFKIDTKIDIWSNGQGQPDDFILLITFVTSQYVGGLVLNEEDEGGGGGSSRDIQLGVLKDTFGLIFLKTF